MEVKVIEISGYIPSFVSLFLTQKNCTPERVKDIIEVVTNATDKQGFVIKDSEYYDRFNDYMSKVIKYGVQYEHETILDFIKVSILMFGLHRGAQDDYDAHAKRMDIIRTSSRHKAFVKHPEVSDWYKDKIIAFNGLEEIPGIVLPEYVEKDGYKWIKTVWGYVREDLMKDGDVARGLIPLSISSDNVSTLSLRNLRHVYHMRRKGTHASPELQESMEDMRGELYEKSYHIGDFLGKVWANGSFMERPDTMTVPKG